VSDDLEDLHKDRLKELQEHDRNAVFRFFVWIALGFLLTALVVAVTHSLQGALVVFGLVILVAIASGD
jgi:Flp pilus assembly protein TadB